MAATPLEHRKRCAWALTDPLLMRYHDQEWGVPEHDDRRLFEFLLLEAMQAGLSWLTILKKRANLRRALDGFDPHKIAAYNAHKLAALMADGGIVRHRRKLEATIQNARAFLQTQAHFGGFAAFIWRYVDGRPLQNRRKAQEAIPTHTPLSYKLSRELKQRGFTFVGPTICYAFMQAVGMVNDHILDCYRHREILKMSNYCGG